MSYEGHDSKDDELLVTFVERFVPTPVVLDYLVRKLLLGAILVNMFALRQASKVYGFNYSAEVSDREAWNWELGKKVPRYHAQVEKVN